MTSPPIPNQFRIAVLLCDVPIPSVKAAHGDYGDVFRELFRNSDPNANFVVDKFDVRDKQEYPENPDLYDAVLLTGSGESLHEIYGSKCVERLLTARKFFCYVISISSLSTPTRIRLKSDVRSDE